MPHINPTRRGRRARARSAAAVSILLIACIALAACGSSSSTSSSSATTSASATTPSGSTGARALGGARFTALRECLKKAGITLPQRTPGQRPQGGVGGFGGAISELPKGVTAAQMKAALQKCGALRAGLRRFNSHPNKTAFAKFAACMRQHGVNLPEPNTSGSGPVFDTKGVNTSSPQFLSAESKCRTDLLEAYRSSGPPPPGVGGPGAP